MRTDSNKKRRQNCTSAQVTGVISLYSRHPYSAQRKNEWTNTASVTVVMTTCKRHRLIHKYKFEWLVLGKRTIKCKRLKQIFYRNTGQTRNHYHVIRIKNEKNENGCRKHSVRVYSENCKKKYTKYGWHIMYHTVITRERDIKVVTTHGQYNDHSHNIGLHVTIIQWRHMNNIINTHIRLGYM